MGFGFLGLLHVPRNMDCGNTQNGPRWSGWSQAVATPAPRVGVLGCRSWLWLLLQLPGNAHPGRQQGTAQAESLPPSGRAGWGSCLLARWPCLAQAWPWRAFGNEQKGAV